MMDLSQCHQINCQIDVWNNNKNKKEHFSTTNEDVLIWVYLSVHHSWSTPRLPNLSKRRVSPHARDFHLVAWLIVGVEFLEKFPAEAGPWWCESCRKSTENPSSSRKSTNLMKAISTLPSGVSRSFPRRIRPPSPIWLGTLRRAEAYNLMMFNIICIIDCPYIYQ